MKTNRLYIPMLALALAAGFTSCEDFLDREPMSTIDPEIYFTDASQLESYANQLYDNILPSHGNWSYGIFGEDAGTDNQTGPDANDRYATGRWRVPNKDNDNWKFEWIYRCNFFLDEVLENSVPSWTEARTPLSATWLQSSIISVKSISSVPANISSAIRNTVTCRLLPIRCRTRWRCFVNRTSACPVPKWHALS